jgi:hypothetical protein
MTPETDSNLNIGNPIPSLPSNRLKQPILTKIFADLEADAMPY